MNEPESDTGPDALALVALSPSLTAVLDTAGVPRFLTPNAAALFEAVEPDDEPAFQTAFNESLQRPGRPVPVRFRARAGGRTRHLTGQFLNRVDDPRVAGVVLYLTDTTAGSTRRS